MSAATIFIKSTTTTTTTTAIIENIKEIVNKQLLYELNPTHAHSPSSTNIDTILNPHIQINPHEDIAKTETSHLTI